MVRQALERITGIRNKQDGTPRVNHPQQQGLLREDNTPYLASMYFPCLFSNEKGDPFVGGRARDVAFADHLRHLIKFAGRPEGGAAYYRFASHRTFRYWALDIKMRTQVRDQCRVFLRQNQELVETPLEITPELIQQIIGVTTRYTGNLSGTDAFWMGHQAKLGAAVDQLPSFNSFHPLLCGRSPLV